MLDARCCDLKIVGWLYKDRNFNVNQMTPEEKAMLDRACSDLGFHYCGEGRCFTLLGKACAEAMQDMLK